MKRNMLSRLFVILALFIVFIGSANAADTINFNNYTIDSYANQDFTNTYDVLDDGATLALSGNTWKRISLPYTITDLTVIEFDFKSTSAGEIQGVIFDDDNATSTDKLFRLIGSQGEGYTSHLVYQGSDWMHFRIPVGLYYSGQASNLVFVCDDDASASGACQFRNVSVYDSSTNASSAVPLNFSEAVTERLVSQDLSGGATVQDSGATISLSGNSWRRMFYPYEVTNRTILGFDFKSSSIGELHGIELDTTTGNTSNRAFIVAGSQTDYGDNSRSYYSGSDWMHFEIPVGASVIGSINFITFICDDDVNQTAESMFRNVVVREMAAGETAEGVCLRQVWSGLSTQPSIDELKTLADYPNTPSSSALLSKMDAPQNSDNYYGSRILALLTPPTSGDYTFWISSDDSSELWLSTDSDSANKVKIANAPAWTYHLQWDKYSEQQSQPVTLVGGQQYYIEAVQVDGNNSDSLAVAWSGPGLEQAVISGQYLSLPDDTTPPMAPTTFSTDFIAPEKVEFSWLSGSDNLGIARYHVYRNGEEVGVTESLNFTDSSLTPSTTYSYTVVAEDFGANLSSPSSAYEITTTALPAAGNGTGLLGKYYNNVDLTERVLSRVDPTVNFDWAYGSPDESISVDGFSARWEGEVEAQYTEEYTFYARSDDGVRLWVDDKLLINYWGDQSSTERSGKISLEAGKKYAIRMDYYENAYNAVAMLSWSSKSQSKQIIPATQLYPAPDLGACGIAILTSAESKVNPAWVEGMVGENATSITVSINGGESFDAYRLNTNEWFADNASASGKPRGIILTQGNATPITISATDGSTTNTATQALTWTSTDISTESEISVRKDSSLLLTASGTGTVLTIDADGDGVNDFTGVPGDTFAFEYTTAGSYTAGAKIDGVDAGTLIVSVVEAGVVNPLACMTGVTRTTSVSVVPAASASVLSFESSDIIKSTTWVNSITATGVSLNVKTPTTEVSKLYVRLGEGVAPIMEIRDIQGFFLKYVTKSSFPVLKTFSDGDSLTAGCIQATPVIPGAIIKMTIFAGGSVFESGSTVKYVESSEFDVHGQLNFYQISPTSKVCHKMAVVDSAP